MKRFLISIICVVCLLSGCKKEDKVVSENVVGNEALEELEADINNRESEPKEEVVVEINKTYHEIDEKYTKEELKKKYENEEYIEDVIYRARCDMDKDGETDVIELLVKMKVEHNELISRAPDFNPYGVGLYLPELDTIVRINGDEFKMGMMNPISKIEMIKDKNEYKLKFMSSYRQTCNIIYIDKEFNIRYDSIGAINYIDGGFFSYNIEDSNIIIIGVYGEFEDTSSMYKNDYTEDIFIIPSNVNNLDVVEIRKGTFEKCKSEYVVIPNSVIKIEEDAIPKDIKIITTEGSYAESYAKENGINSEIIKNRWYTESEIKNKFSTKEKEFKNYSSIDMELLKLENKETNMVYSPLSIKYALGMLREGANDEMKGKINKVIGEDFNPYYNMMNSKNFSIANGLLVRKSMKNNLDSGFIDIAKNKYNADIIVDDFTTANNINKWISNKTFGTVNDVMKDADIKFIDFGLVNTIAIDMEWFVKFDEAYQFEKMDFYKEDNNTTKKVLGLSDYFSIDKFEFPPDFPHELYQAGDTYKPYPDIYMTEEYYKETAESFCYNLNSFFSVYQDAEISVVSELLKEYDGKQLEFVAIKPNNKTLKEYISNFTSEDFNKILRDLEIDTTKEGYETFIDVMFPKFQFEYEIDLKEELFNLGLGEIFEDKNNSFENIASYFKLDNAKNKTQIDVNEEGIKAASVTQLVGKGGGNLEVPSVYVDVVMDKPFLFFVIDTNTKDIVFSGTVYDPTDYDTAYNSIKW